MTHEVRKCLLGSGCDSWLQIQWILDAFPVDFRALNSSKMYFYVLYLLVMNPLLGRCCIWAQRNLISPLQCMRSSFRACSFSTWQDSGSRKKKKKIGINLLYQHFWTLWFIVASFLAMIIFFFSNKIHAGCFVAVREGNARGAWSDRAHFLWENMNTELNAAWLWFRAVPQKFATW